MASKDYYEILGVSKQATADEIKKHFRKLAVQFHPDRNQGDVKAEERFKEINEAYAVLSDPEKRKQYDTFGSAGFQQQFSQEDIFRNFNFSDVFSEMGMGGNDEILSRLFGRGFRQGGSFSHSPRRGHDVALDISVSFHDAILGTEKQVAYTIDGKQEHIKVKIPAGVDNGSRIRVAGKGAAGSSGAASGDLFLDINVIPDPELRREGGDLFITKYIRFSEASLGSSLELSTLEGSKRIKIPAGIQSGTKIRLKGHGIKPLGSNMKGDMYVVIAVHVPEALTDTQRALLQQLQEQGL